MKSRTIMRRLLAPDDTKIYSLRQLNNLLGPDAQGWTLVRAREGYYYWVHPTCQPSEGVMVFSCKGTTLGFWRTKCAECIAKNGV